jgi:GNAT superfamily N-acetyltransferase
MVKTISWSKIVNIWKNNLWPNRQSPIETNSAMCYLEGIDMSNMYTNPTYFGYIIDNQIVGVNSGHKCSDNSYRSRGLWVDPSYRNRGIGTALLLETIDQAMKEYSDFTWSFPRASSWHTYKKAGFNLSSDWMTSETSDKNAYCIKKIL